ncbi:MAG TPA: cellulase family glycosylhydrolase [Kineosporiaceae bacterium]|nr:cellulase family glycosylhydrolase [Kineosporiaceae bacterium]
MARKRIVAAAAALAVIGPLGAAWAAGSQDGSACQVAYRSVAEWPGGFLADVVVTNSGPAVTDWTLRFTFPNAGQRLIQGWNGKFAQSGSGLTVTSASWNGALKTDASARIGFVALQKGSNPKPSDFTLNGVTCNGPAPAPTPTPTPTATQTTAPAPSTSTPTTPPPTSATTTSAAPTTPEPSTSAPTATQPVAGAAPALKVSGNKLVTASGAPYRLLGVNRSGGEFGCVQQKAIFDGPVDAAAVDAMRTWKVRTVRIPLNEECWLGTDTADAASRGEAYQKATKDFVNLLISKGITPIVEMHWNNGQYSGDGAGCSDVKATCQKPMPDAALAPKFWTGVANAFKGNDAVIFEPFNEPYPDAPAKWDATKSWTCWRDGGTCTGISYQVAGMQSLVDAIRATGATNVIMLGGLEWSNNLREWLTYMPKDPQKNLAAVAHVYNFNGCVDTTCWDTYYGKVAAEVPLVLTEIGQNSCAHDFIDKVMAWADTKNIGYLAWTWDPWGCSSGSVLITDWTGTPTQTFGQGFKDHLTKISN